MYYKHYTHYSKESFTDFNNKYFIIIKPVFVGIMRQNIIYIYTVDGKFVFKCFDNLISNTMFSRTMGNVTRTIDHKNFTVSTSIKVDLDVIKEP